MKHFITHRPPLDITLKDVVYWKENDDNDDLLKKKKKFLNTIATGVEWNMGCKEKSSKTEISLKTFSKLKIKVRHF
jgi:hypothetical protein